MNKQIQEIEFSWQFENKKNHTIDNENHIKDFLRVLLNNTFKKKGFILNYIFLSKKDILSMNKKYLNHNYSTDVITFDFSDDFGIFGGDIYICPEIVNENAILYKTKFQNELLRVIFHGLLHLIGFDDNNEENILVMREKEEFCLKLYSEFILSYK